MTKAKITKQGGYDCAPEGHTVINFPMGAIVDGQVAEWALSDSSASRMFDPRKETKVETAVETKAKPPKRKKASK